MQKPDDFRLHSRSDLLGLLVRKCQLLPCQSNTVPNWGAFPDRKTAPCFLPSGRKHFQVTVYTSRTTQDYVLVKVLGSAETSICDTACFLPSGRHLMAEECLSCGVFLFFKIKTKADW